MSQLHMFQTGDDLPLFSGVPQTVRIKPFDAERAESKQLGFFICPICRDTGTIKIHHNALPGGVKEIPCMDARHGPVKDDTTIAARLGGTTIAVISGAETDGSDAGPEPPPIEPAPTYTAREIKPRKKRERVEPELKQARERAAQYFAPLFTTRLIAERQIETLDQIRKPEDIARILFPYFRGLDKEHMLAIALSTKNHVLGVNVVYVGSVHTTVVRLGEVLRPAVLMNAPALIVAHNHPSGEPTPSPEDAAITRELNKAAQLLDIDLLDHIVIGANEKFVSLKERGLGF